MVPTAIPTVKHVVRQCVLRECQTYRYPRAGAGDGNRCARVPEIEGSLPFPSERLKSLLQICLRAHLDKPPLLCYNAPHT